MELMSLPEFVDGLMVNKPRPSFHHGELALIVGGWFRCHRKLWEIRVATGAKVDITPTRYRIADLLVSSALGTDESGNPPSPPLVAIEILSPEDKFRDIHDRAADLQAAGVNSIWMIAPEESRQYVWQNNSWYPQPELQAKGPIWLDSDYVWTRFKELPPMKSGSHEM